MAGRVSVVHALAVPSKPAAFIYSVRHRTAAPVCGAGELSEPADGGPDVLEFGGDYNQVRGGFGTAGDCGRGWAGAAFEQQCAGDYGVPNGFLLAFDCADGGDDGWEELRVGFA